jgi:hypothetical protein
MCSTLEEPGLSANIRPLKNTLAYFWSDCDDDKRFITPTPERRRWGPVQNHLAERFWLHEQQRPEFRRPSQVLGAEAGERGRVPVPRRNKTRNCQQRI